MPNVAEMLVKKTKVWWKKECEAKCWAEEHGINSPGVEKLLDHEGMVVGGAKDRVIHLAEV